MTSEMIFKVHPHASQRGRDWKWQPSGAIPRRTVYQRREGNLPVWVRAPKHGMNFIPAVHARSSTNGGKGFIRSVSIREPGRVKGVRLFHLASIFAFIERCEASAEIMLPASL